MNEGVRGCRAVKDLASIPNRKNLQDIVKRGCGGQPSREIGKLTKFRSEALYPRNGEGDSCGVQRLCASAGKSSDIRKSQV